MPGPAELLIILVIVLVLFGAGRIPEVFEALGVGLKKFREAQEDLSLAPPPAGKTPPKVTQAPPPPAVHGEAGPGEWS